MALLRKEKIVFFDSMTSLEQYLNSNSSEMLLKEALLGFYGSKLKSDLELDQLKEMFDAEDFNETNKKADYFLENIIDLKENIEEYKKTYQNLADDLSKQIFIYMLNAKILIENSYIEKAYSYGEMYFDKRLFDLSQVKTYVDCGGYIGDSAIKFSLLNDNYEKIYVFEPVKSIFDKAKKNLSAYLQQDKYILIDKATYNTVGDIGIDESAMGDAAINLDNKENIVKTTTLDHEISDKIDLIKFDVEGAEKEAILGAKEHIIKDTPILAVCVYHLKDDYWKIPQLVLSLNENYNLYLRQYDTEVYAETVMYFIPKVHDLIKARDNHNSIVEFFKFYASEDNENIVQHIKDKKWFIRQLRYKNIDIKDLQDSISELNKWNQSLQESKDYLSNQDVTQQERISELEDWVKSLEDAKQYLTEKDVVQQERIKELESWTKELEESKVYLSDKDNLQQERIKELESWTQSLEESKAYLSDQDVLQQERIKELEDWTKELEDAKSWIESQVAQKDSLIVDLQKNVDDLIAERNQIKNENSKMKYKLNKLLEDKWIQKIINLKKYDI